MKANNGSKVMTKKAKAGTSLHKFVSMGGKPSNYNKQFVILLESYKRHHGIQNF